MPRSLHKPPPETEHELMHRAAGIAGRSLEQLAAELGVTVPAGQKRAKGWIGEQLEHYLGANAASLPQPDFRLIGVELKTLPIDRNRKPRESTYICTVQLTRAGSLCWEESVVRRKLSRVLWIPVEADPAIPLARRRIGNGFLWSPSLDQERRLRTDWEELTDMLYQGELDLISAHFGAVLQIRPKAANAAALTRSNNATGEIAHSLPRGFYLRPAFTGEILRAAGFTTTPPPD